MELSYNTLKKILQSSSMENLSLADLEKFFREEKQISRHIPEGYWREDPRNGDKVLYNASRMKRPHDNINSIKENGSAVQAECELSMLQSSAEGLLLSTRICSRLCIRILTLTTGKIRLTVFIFCNGHLPYMGMTGTI